MAKRRRFTPQFKAEVVIEVLTGQSTQAELCRKHNLSQDQLSKWKHQLIQNAAMLFESTDKPSDDATERIAQLEQLVGRLTLKMVEVLQTDYSVRQICDTLGFNRSNLY